MVASSAVLDTMVSVAHNHSAPIVAIAWETQKKCAHPYADDNALLALIRAETHQMCVYMCVCVLVVCCTLWCGMRGIV